MTVQDAIRLLRTEQLGDSEWMELAKQMGARALENSQLHFTVPRCGKCGSYVIGIEIKYAPELRNRNLICVSNIDPAQCPKCHIPFVSVDIDFDNQTCILRGLKEENNAN